MIAVEAPNGKARGRPDGPQKAALISSRCSSITEIAGDSGGHELRWLECTAGETATGLLRSPENAVEVDRRPLTNGTMTIADNVAALTRATSRYDSRRNINSGRPLLTLIDSFPR
jgi:hypothetical protein